LELAPSNEDVGPAFKYDPRLYNEARDAVTEGREPGEERPVVFSTPTAPSMPTGEAPGLINVELPYDSGLSISGRKLIAVSIKETRRKSAEKAREQGLPQRQREFDMRQELQVRIKGKVGPKITVNVDFDDTKDDKRDISVVYQGDPEEVVQEAAFGDIMLSLPSTEFVSYSKQLFGVRTRLKYKNAQLTAIGSRTKGVTETKRFNGNVKFERKEILDTSYIKRRHYNLDFASASIRAGTLRVWRDDLQPTNNANAASFIVRDYAVPSTFWPSAGTGSFDLLSEGVDYNVDLARNIITFTREVPLNAVLAIDYQFVDGTQLSAATGGSPVILKTEGDKFISSASESGYKLENKTFYSLGQTRIVPDNGRGNFLFKTIDLNRLDNVVNLTAGALTYPNTVEMDFTNGVFNLKKPLLVLDSTLYDQSPLHKFSFQVEYRYKVKSYIVKPNIVFGSERVSLNGRLLSRDVDYFMDYDSGFLTFFDEDQIDETSQIEVTYEFAPFGGQLGETLVGTRAELDLIPGRVKMGSTFLYTFAPRPTLVPDLRSTPRSLMVLEADGQFNEIKVPFTPAILNLSGEAAQSSENPNLFGRALVDSMEGVKQEIQPVLGPESWRTAANPAPSSNGISRPDAFGVGDEQLKLKDVNPNVGKERENDKLRVLALDWNLGSQPGFPGTPELASLASSISRSGLDFSKRLYLEMWVEGAGSSGSGVDVLLDAGQLNEDADGDVLLDTEDDNVDGGLNPGEDTGWTFNDPGPDATAGSADDRQVLVGPNNGRLDTEDLDGDGALRRVDVLPRSIPLLQLSNLPADAKMYNPATGGSDPHSDLNFTGWRFIQVPLNIATTEETAFQAIKQVRVTLRNAAGGASRSGRIRIGKISFVGNTWEKPSLSVAGSTMTLSAVNNIDNPEYGSLLGESAYKELYKDEASNRTREQALSLQYDLQAGSTATTRQVYQLARDFSKHNSLQFFLRIPAGKPAGGRFVFQMGSETDYYEYSVPLTARYQNIWVLETIKLTDVNLDGTPDIMTPLNGDAQVRIVGSPSFQRIGQLKAGIVNDTGTPLLSELWLNEIHVTGSRKKVGGAHRFSADLSWPGWGTMGGRVREVDRNFQTLTSQVLNQDVKDASANFALSRLSFLPLSGNVAKAETVTPAVFRTGDAGLVSILSEGRETSVTGRADGQLLLPGLPAFGFSYDKALAKSTTRGETRDRDSYTASADYQVPWTPDLMPGKLSFTPMPKSVFARYIRSNNFLSFAPSTGTVTSRDTLFNRTRTVEVSDDWSGRASFELWRGFSLTPTYGLKKSREERRFSAETLAFAPDFAAARRFDKAMSQTVGLSGSLRVTSWFEPRFNASLAGSETNILPTASSTTAYNVKLVDRTANGDLFWTFAARDLLPRWKPVQSFRLDSSYRVESGDAYENVDSGDRAWRQVKPFKFKRINRRGGRQMYGLLEPLTPTNAGARRKQLTARNTLRSSGDWSPFDWLSVKRPWEPFRTLHFTVTVTNTDEHTEAGESIKDISSVIWPDVTASIRDTERFLYLERWMSNSQLNVRTNTKKAETFGEEFRQDDALNSDYRFTWRQKYDVFLSYGVTDGLSRDLRTGAIKSTSEGFNHSGQVGFKWREWRLTPRTDFTGSRATDGAGKLTSDLTSQAVSLIMRLDKSTPQGFRIPFTRKVFQSVSRFILDTKISYDRKKSSLDVERTNIDTYTGDMTGEWEVSKNFRLSFGGGVSMSENRVRKENGFMSYQATSQLVIQF
jgi:hypothetical protein